MGVPMRCDRDPDAERAAMCDTFDAVGPARRTLCEGWTTADLAAHLIVR